MKTLARVAYLAATLSVALVTSACGSSASDFDGPSAEAEDDEAWGEPPLGNVGKADGTWEATLAARKEFAAKFQLPTLTDAEQQEVLARYSNIDVDREAPRDLLEDALLYYDFNWELLENPDYLTLIDFSQHSSKRRLYVVDMQTGELARSVVAHGSGSDPDNDGVPTQFSNVNNSHKSSLGFYVAAETYHGKWGLSLRLDGLSETNSDARPRAIVMHGASYVVDGKAKQGRSWGCPAIPMSSKDALIAKLKAGSLMYAERSAE